eukprot:gene17202-20464_t
MEKNMKMLIDMHQNSATKRNRDSLLKEQPHLVIPYSQLKLRGELGSGGFGVVHRAMWQGNKVAYKELSIESVNKRILANLYQEAYVMNLLRHPNVCGFFGVVAEKDDKKHHYGLVMQYYNGGSLDDLLQDDDLPLGPDMYINMAVGMASAMLHLHSRDPVVLHGDLKSRNVLLAEKFNPDVPPRCVLCDFGLSKVRSNTSTMASTMATRGGGQGGTLNWTPPEVLAGRSLKKPGDVYCFGMLLYELVARVYPFQGMQDVVVMQRVSEGHRPPIPENCDAAFSELIQ